MLAPRGISAHHFDDAGASQPYWSRPSGFIKDIDKLSGTSALNTQYYGNAGGWETPNWQTTNGGYTFIKRGFHHYKQRPEPNDDPVQFYEAYNLSTIFEAIDRCYDHDSTHDSVTMQTLVSIVADSQEEEFALIKRAKQEIATLYLNDPTIFGADRDLPVNQNHPEVQRVVGRLDSDISWIRTELFRHAATLGVGGLLLVPPYNDTADAASTAEGAVDQQTQNQDEQHLE